MIFASDEGGENLQRIECLLADIYPISCVEHLLDCFISELLELLLVDALVAFVNLGLHLQSGKR